MKTKLIPLLACLVLIGCTTSQQTTAFKTIGTAEAAVIGANAGFLDSVVTGQTSTNAVPTVEAAFNATQLALHQAAALASGGTNAPPSPATAAQAQNFINLANSTKGFK